MTNDQLQHILSNYDIHKPEFKFIRRSENIIYKVADADGRFYLLRIHQSVNTSLVGLQHTFGGLLEELEMLEALSTSGRIKAQMPIRNLHGDFITTIEHEGKPLNCSVLTWLEGRDSLKDDYKDLNNVKKLGARIATLHAFFKQYPHNIIQNRPSQDIAYNDQLVHAIKRGLELNLFTASDVETIERSIKLINSRLDDQVAWGLIHGDMGMNNTIIDAEGEMGFIDFGFFGTGYYLADVAMGAMMVPSEHRDIFLEGYYGTDEVPTEDIILLEGFMLVAIIGYYVFQMDNESVYDWMKERMPRLCANHCIPFLAGERIFYKF